MQVHLGAPGIFEMISAYLAAASFVDAASIAFPFRTFFFSVKWYTTSFAITSRRSRSSSTVFSSDHLLERRSVTSGSKSSVIFSKSFPIILLSRCNCTSLPSQVSLTVALSRTASWILYEWITSPNTSLVDLSSFSIGVPVNPIFNAFGSARCKFCAIFLYCERCASSAMMMMFRLSDMSGYFAMPSRSSSVTWNFWIVVKIIFPAGTSSFSLRSTMELASSTAVLGLGYGNPATSKKPFSCSSKSFLSVRMTKVGFSSSLIWEIMFV